MRPISLEIEGFTSFRERVLIDLSNLDLFAITGPTGAGKTSIIDAMTYALYGCTPRIGEKQVAELISQGLNRMMVLFTFRSGKNEYRIARAGKWTGKQMNTDIRLEQRSGGDWVSLADGVQKAKPIIQQIVGLDFNGFTKSVVLPQGRFDEFLKGKAEDRRKILSDLLDLAVYKRMMQRANALHGDHKAQAAAITDTLQKEYGDATPERLAQLRKSLEQTRPRLEEIAHDLARLTRCLPTAHSLRDARRQLSKAQAELKDLGPERKAAEDRLKRIQKAIEDLNGKLTGVASALERNTYDHAEHLRLSGMLDKARRLESVLLQHEQAERARKETAARLQKLDLEARRLEANAENAAKDCSGVREELEKHRKALNALQERYGSPAAVQAAIETQKQRLKEETVCGKLKTELQSKDIERNKLDKDLEAAESVAIHARERRDRTRSEYEALVRMHSAELLKLGLQIGEPCPVCEQSITRLPKRRKHQPVENAKQRWNVAEKASSVAEKRVASLQALVLPLERERASLEVRVRESEQSIREYAERLRPFEGVDLVALKEELERMQRQVEAAAKTVEELTGKSNAAANALKDHQLRRALLQKDIDTNTLELQRLQNESERLRDELGSYADLKRLQAEVARQEEARSERQRLDNERNTLHPQLSKAKDDLAKAMSVLEGLEATRRRVEEAAGMLQSRIQEDIQLLNAEFPQLKEASGERDEAFQLEQESRKAHATRDEIQRRIIELEASIKSVEVRIARAAEMKEQLDRHRTQMATAKMLHQALQGDEFIAFIQEEAYSRLAADGSVHLRTLSAERYSFTIEKDEFYVLDHWNADEPRPVTTLSGGESFLASLALALALAEGLSGLSSGHTKFALESLFLDEGFGTLDAETLEYVVAGIEGLSTNNRLIGIISHIPELAERMPARIHVEKSVGGSSITVT
jgi:exonuclease SbcC